MSENTCSKRGCEHEKYKDDKYCILHCDKKDFDDRDINLFWQEFIKEYPRPNELVIENITFPKFRQNYVGRGFFYSYNGFPQRYSNVKFIKCIFKDDFRADYEEFVESIIFENCEFHGNISVSLANKKELINCEFKNDFLLENFNCKNLDIKNTKFIKNSDIRVANELNIDENSIFRSDCYLYGNGSSNLNCQNSQFDKELIINNVFTVNIDNIVLKSNISFLNGQDEVNLKNIVFPKNITFESVHSMSFENIKVNDLQFSILDILTVNNSELLGRLKFTKNMVNLTIRKSKLTKEVQAVDITNITLDEVEFLDIVNFVGIHNDINLKKCMFDKLRINTTHTININESNFLNIELFGETYQKLNFENIKIQDSLEINNAKEVSLSKLEANLLKSIGQKSESFIVSDFQVENLLFESDDYDNIKIEHNYKVCNIDFNSNIIKNILLDNLTIESLNLNTENIDEFIIKPSSIIRVNLKSEINGFTNFDNCRIKEFINIQFKLLNNIVFNKIEEEPTIIINSNEYNNINILESKLKSLYINAYEYLEENEQDNNGIVTLTNSIIRDDLIIPNIKNLSSTDNKFYGKVNISKIEGSLELQNCIFKDIVDFSQGIFNDISIKSSTFKEKLDFCSSSISKINIVGQDLHCVFNSQVKFDSCTIANISVLNSDFEDEISFNNIDYINLFDIQSTKIEKLNICNSTIIDLFYRTELLSINEFLLDSVKLSSTQNDKDIDIEKIDINELKCNKLIIQNALNFNEMKINKFRISNSNVEKVFRIRYSKINNIFFTDTTFEDLQIIENKNDKFEEPREFRLRNTTIKSTVLDKLKLDNFNMSDAHVSDAKIGYVRFKNGSRETNRFFKNYYDSISDYIKANEYYKDEMEEQYNTTKKYSSEWWILGFNKIISDFGQDWVRPLLLILGVTVAIFIMINFTEFRKENYILTNKLCIWNNFWEFLNPFSKTANDKYKSVYWLWMIHKLLITIFIYHFIVAIKRKTKR